MKQVTGLLLILLLTAVALVGCGGSGSGTSSGSRTVGVVSSVTDSSITVGGTTFDTSSAAVSGDEITSVDQVQEGMVVSVDGAVDGVSNSGTADDIDYDAEVEGKVDVNDLSGGGDFIVMGQNIDVSQNPTFESKMVNINSISDIPVGAMVEVSGYSNGNGNIVATYIKVEDHMADENDEMELEGIVASVDAQNGTFMIGEQVIHYEPSNFNITLEAGMNVEVDIEMISGQMHAVEIEEEDDFGDDDDGEIEIEGMVTSNGVAADGTFAVNGQTVMLGDNVKFEDGMTRDGIVMNAIIEVEGHIQDGMLIVTEVEAEDGDDEMDDGMDSSPDSSDDTAPPAV